jgi:peptidoglycan/xylan/chitin deacetylase (PgdA/CDA1 family)
MGILDVPGYSRSQADKLFTTASNARAAGKASRGMICLILDDNWLNQYTFAAPAIEARGGRATFATNSSTFGGSNRMTSAQVLDLFNRGHEIANHSLTHYDMTTLTAAQRASEWDDAQAAITSLIGQPATTFVYPYNKTTLAIDQQNYLRYDRAFAGNNIPFLEPMTDRDTFLHGRWSWSNDTSSIHTRALNFVRMAATSDTVFTIFCHQILPTTTANDGNVTETQFIELLDLANSLGVPIVPANVAFPRYNRLPDAGMESTNTLYHRVTGTGTGNTYTSVVESPLSNYFTGSRFKRFTGDGTATMRDVQDVYIPIRSSETWTLSARFRQSYTSGTGSRLIIQEYDTYGTQIGSDIAGTAQNTTLSDWTQVTLDYTPSATARSFSVGWRQDTMVGTTDCDHMAIDLKRRPALG